jgi:hypothetical protein
MRSMILARVALVLALATVGCGSGGHRTGVKDRNLITADEIVRVNANTAYEAVERLRPAFLTTRGATSLQDQSPVTAVVYLDGLRYGTVTSLSTIPATGIASIQFLPPIEAGMRYGLGHEGGAILIVSKR